MMGTLATALAGKRIPTPEDRYRADVEGDIENVEGVLKITCIRVRYLLRLPADRAEEARAAFSSYLARCPAAQSVIGCIRLEDELILEEIA